MEDISKLIELKQILTDLRSEHWINNVIFTSNWWILLLISIFPWIIWWKFVNKKRFIEILLFGALISIYSILLDDIGSYYLLWMYEYQLVPISPRLNPVDLTLIPVTYMFMYQYFRSWKSFLIAQTVLAFGVAFIVEPIFIWLGIYKALSWKLIYSFLIYIALGIFNKWVVDRFVKLNRKIGYLLIGKFFVTFV
jgi:hypothetical protein